MKKHVNTLLTALVYMISGVSLAVSSLSDTELASISGGGIDSHHEGQNLNQNQQQPQRNSSNYMPAIQFQKIDGLELTPEFFSILQSTINVNRNRTLFLSGNAQQNAIAFNLENILSSDIISANNVFNGDNLTLNNVMTKLEINQYNNLYQLHRSQGMLNSLNTGSRYEKTIESKSGSENYDYHTYSNIYHQRQSNLQYMNIDVRNAHVGVRFTPTDNIVTYSPPLDLIDVKYYGPYLRYIHYDDDGNQDYGYTGTTFSGIGLSLNSIGVKDGILGDDLILTTNLTAPEIDFGKTFLDSFINIDIDFGSIGGGTTTEEYAIPGLGVHIDELNFGTGFSLSGDGSHTLIESGGLTVDGEVTLGLNAYAKLVIDLSKTVLDIAKETVVDENFSATASIPFVLLNEDFENDSFDPIEGDSYGSPVIISEQSDDDVIENINSVDIAESFINESYEHTVLIGGQMTGAEAELLALSEGSLSLNNNSNILLSDNAQKNMRVFNSVNTVSSVAANAMNISRLPASINGASALSRLSMQQHNHFTQQR